MFYIYFSSYWCHSFSTYFTYNLSHQMLKFSSSLAPWLIHILITPLLLSLHTLYAILWVKWYSIFTVSYFLFLYKKNLRDLKNSHNWHTCFWFMDASACVSIWNVMCSYANWLLYQLCKTSKYKCWLNGWHQQWQVHFHLESRGLVF